MYQITDPFLRKQMAKDGIFWSRYQIPSDHRIFQVCTKLRRAGVIAGQFIDQHSVTNIILTEGSRPLPIRAMREFQTHFQSHTDATNIIKQNSTREDEDLDDDMEIEQILPIAAAAPAPATSPPAESSPAVNNSRIIDIP